MNDLMRLKAGGNSHGINRLLEARSPCALQVEFDVRPPEQPHRLDGIFDSTAMADGLREPIDRQWTGWPGRAERSRSLHQREHIEYGDGRIDPVFAGISLRHSGRRSRY